MPYLVDSGPPVDASTLAAARNELPREYGVRVVEQQAGRRAVLVRVPRAKPDYNYELAEVAFYATLEDVKDAKDVLLIGDEKTIRMEPLRLRDHIREQTREDRELIPPLRTRVPRDFGWTLVQSPSNVHHKGLLLRLPLHSVTEADEATLMRARNAIGDEIVNALRETQYVYLVADNDFGRIGRRIFVDAVATDLADQLNTPDTRSAAPIHRDYQTPGHTIPRG